MASVGVRINICVRVQISGYKFKCVSMQNIHVLYIRDLCVMCAFFSHVVVEYATDIDTSSAQRF